MSSRIDLKNTLSTIRSWFQPHTATPSKPATTTTTPPAQTLPKDLFDPLSVVKNLFPKDGNRSVLDALSEGNEVLAGPKTSKETAQNAVITTDPANVNDKADVNEKGTRHLEAEAQLKTNAGLEKLMLDKLSPEARKQYEDVKASLAPDAVAQLSLQMLLFSYKLSGKKSLAGGENVLQGLSNLSSQKLAEGIDRKQLLSDLVQELACPSAINQSDRGTCAATVVAIDLLMSNPAEYVRLVRGLATPEGSVKTASGTVARREAGTEVEDGTRRSISQRLLAPALMEIANGKWDYDNKDDSHHNGNKIEGSGLSAHQVDVLLEAVFGKDFAYSQNIDKASDKKKEAAYELIKDELKSGEKVLAGIIWGETTSGPGGTVTHTGHKVLVTDTKVRDGKEYVVYVNPWGRTEEMPKEEFLSRLRNVNYLPR